MSEFKVVMVELGHGERLPLLVNKSTTLGVFDVGVFALALRDEQLTTKPSKPWCERFSFLYEILHERDVKLYRRVASEKLVT